MKNLYIMTLFFGIVISILSCSTDEKFTGSPIDSGLNIITLEGIVSADVDESQTILTGQKLDFTVMLPENKVFTDTVTVEVSSVAQSGVRTRAYVDVMPGESSASGEINAVGGSVFNTTFDMTITAIKLQTVEPGIHYLMKSNTRTFKTGNTGIPATDSNLLKIRVISELATTTNRFKLLIDRPGSGADGTGSFNNGVVSHNLQTGPSGTENSSQSFGQGEYTFSLAAQALPSASEDKEYRILIVFPNGDVKVYDGVYGGLTLLSPPKPVLKVTKTGTGLDAVFEVTPL